MDCDGCGQSLNIDDYEFEQHDGGKAFHPDFGEYSWWEGDLICPFCGHKTPYADSSI